MITFNPTRFQGRPHAAAPRFSGKNTEQSPERNNAAKAQAEASSESTNQPSRRLHRQDRFVLTNEQLRPSAPVNSGDDASNPESESDNEPDSGLGTPVHEDVEDARDSRFLNLINPYFQRFQRDETPAESLQSAQFGRVTYDSSPDEYEPEGSDTEGDNAFAHVRRSLSYTHADRRQENEQLIRQALQAIQERRKAEASQPASRQDSPSSSQDGPKST